MRKCLFAFIIFSCIVSTAQTSKQIIAYADENAKLGDFYGASIYYKKALSIDSTDIHLLFKYAESLRQYNNYTLAGYYYQKINEKDKGGRIYPEAYFWKASMLKYNGEYKKAQNAFKKCKSVFGKKKKEYFYLKSKQEIASCSYALRNKNDSNENCQIDHLGEGVNTTDSEFGGFYWKDTLLYSSLKGSSMNELLEIGDEKSYKIRIYEAHGKENWKVQSAIDTNINSALSHNANGCFNKQETKFYFSRCDTLNKCAIYVSTFNGKAWSRPKILSEKVNHSKAKITTQPHITVIDEKQYIIYSSDRPGGYGSLDLWYSEILDGNTFSKSENLGKKINSPDPEVTAFYNSKDKELYFSSSWHKGLGGFDVFKSVGTLDQLGDPENMLAPVNTQWNDLYFTLDDNYEKGFITSNRLGVFFKKGPTCCNDLWSVEYINKEEEAQKEIETLDDLNKFLPVTLYFHNDRPGPKSTATSVKDNYMITYDRYKVLQPTYREEYSKGLKDDQKNIAEQDIDDFFKNYVDQGVDDLELFAKLLLIELDKGEKIEVTVKGFASPLAKSDYNVNLTKRRISSLVNYLREYDQGQYNKYIDDIADNGGQLTFLKIPFGEYTANSNVSDDYYDQKNSIYNRSAALERKIEIQSVTYAEKDSIYAGLTVASGTYDFGKLKQGEKVKTSFIIENTGNKELLIENIVVSCGCSGVDYEPTPIPPGGKKEIFVEFNSENLLGKQVKSITVIANSFPKTKRLVVTAEILE